MPEENNDPKPDPKPEPDDGKTYSKTELEAIVEKRLARERGKYSDYDELKAKAGKFDELEAKNKGAEQQLTEKATAAEQRAAAAELNLARMEVAAEKGLTPTQAKRLVGTNKEELASDADASIEDGTFKVADGPKPPPGQKPKPDLKPGSTDPTGDEAEPSATDLIEAIPRL